VRDGLAAGRYPTLEGTATVEPLENGRDTHCACYAQESLASTVIAKVDFVRAVFAFGAHYNNGRR